MPASLLGEGACRLWPITIPGRGLRPADLATGQSHERLPGAGIPGDSSTSGIAERNMITAAAGMASTGLIPYVATFAAVQRNPGRRADTHRLRLTQRCPFVSFGSHSGMSLGFYGTSHHALEDIGMMRHRRPI